MSKLKQMITVGLLLAAVAAGAADRINLNRADAATLAAEINGISPAKAEAIVAYRQTHGPFKSVDDLLLVRGIGEATLKKNRDRLTATTQ